jgi:hypothetical protein
VARVALCNYVLLNRFSQFIVKCFTTKHTTFLHFCRILATIAFCNVLLISFCNARPTKMSLAIRCFHSTCGFATILSLFDLRLKSYFSYIFVLHFAKRTFHFAMARLFLLNLTQAKIVWHRKCVDIFRLQKRKTLNRVGLHDMTKKAKLELQAFLNAPKRVKKTRPKLTSKQTVINPSKEKVR